MRCLIGIDDTDNPDSRGTGYRARRLGALLTEAGVGRLRRVSRHQLLVHPDIPYTSHNSAACLDVDTDEDAPVRVIGFCRQYLLDESAPGSDAGLCVAAFDEVNGEVSDFGRQAKQVVLAQSDARDTAATTRLHLEGLTGDHGGIIGALAAVGLARSGADGRFIWVRGVRELSGVARAGELLANTGIEEIRDDAGGDVPGDARIRVEPWPRPVMIEGRAILLVKRTEENDDDADWELLPKEVIKQRY